MALSFIGFSGCGKSHVTRRFVEELGWRSFACDELIARALLTELPAGPEPATRRLAEWLGAPYTAGFAEREKKYCEAEAAVMEEICAGLERLSPEENVIVDTTGSVVYCGSKVLSSLRANSIVIYFQLPPSDEELLFKQFLEDPKPVIWKGNFRQAANEAPEQALRRCYPALLRERAGLYERSADLTVPAGFSERSEITPEKLLSIIEHS